MTVVIVSMHDFPQKFLNEKHCTTFIYLEMNLIIGKGDFTDRLTVLAASSYTLSHTNHTPQRSTWYGSSFSGVGRSQVLTLLVRGGREGGSMSLPVALLRLMAAARIHTHTI